MNFKQAWPCLSISIVLLSAHCGPTAIAAPAASAKQFMKGGTFCFSLTQPALPQWHETLKFVVQPTVKGRNQQLPLITGLQHGVLLQASPPFEYISQMTGTASYDLTGTSLQISLTSNQAGVDLGGKHPGIWIGQIALTLNASNLSGQAIGSKLFKPVSGGKVHGETFEDAVDGQLRPIACAEF
jgi:hypothetical protein